MQVGELARQSGEAPGAALQRGAPAQVELLQKRAAGRQLRNPILGDVLASPQVQGSEFFTLGSDHAGYHVIVFNLESKSFQSLTCCAQKYKLCRAS